MDGESGMRQIMELVMSHVRATFDRGGGLLCSVAGSS